MNRQQSGTTKENMKCEELLSQVVTLLLELFFYLFAIFMQLLPFTEKWMSHNVSVVTE